MKYLISLFGFLAIANAAVTADIIWLGYGGQNYSKIWTDFSGRIGMQSLVNNSSTAIDLWRTAGTKPALDSLSEITIHRTAEWLDGGKMERFSMSAMATPDGGAAYRFGVERGDGGDYHDIIFCFENTSAGKATCPFKITRLYGPMASDDGGVTWRKL